MAYTITGEKCGTVRLDAEKTGVVVTESVQRSSKVTSNPVEKGSDINDHVINDPVVFSITGVFLDEDQSDILISIHALREEGDSAWRVACSLMTSKSTPSSFIMGVIFSHTS